MEMNKILLFPILVSKIFKIYIYKYIFKYLSKRGIAGVIKALGNDEELDPFTKYLMFTHMYTPEQVKEIGHEEIHRREEKFEKELGLV